MSTFVSVGNATQPFARLVEGVIAIADQLPQPVIVQHGHTTLKVSDAITALAFMNMDEFATQVDTAELLIMHAGAGSLIHAVQAGKVPIVMPRLSEYGEHVDDHQTEFASAIEDSGRIVIAHHASELEGAAQRAQSLQRDLKSKPKGLPHLVDMVGDLLKEIES